MLRDYYLLAKPGIVYGNLLTTSAAFFFASHWHFSPILFGATVLGMGLAIGSACVFNNYLDRDIDAKMERTSARAFPAQLIPVLQALTYGAVLGVVGFALLLYVNLLTAAVTFAGFVVYLAIYTPSKRMTHHSTLAGAIAGAAPLVAGYTAAVDRLDLAALLLFVILAAWQMPHFYSIAIRRSDEYRAAGIPALPIVHGTRVTKILIIAYIVAYAIAAGLFALVADAGYTYLTIVLIPALVWFVIAIKGFSPQDDKAWAKRLFHFSLVVLLAFCVALSIGSIAA